MSDPGERDARSALRARHYDLNSAETPSLLRRCFAREEPRSVTARGDIGIIDEPLIGFFCSIRCPGDIILRTYDLARTLRGTDLTLIGGFQSPMEKEFLDLLLRGSARVVVCPARSIENMRIRREWRTPISDGRLLILSSFGRSQYRATAALAAQRNALVAALATEVVIPYAAPGGKTESLARRHAGAGKSILTLDSPANANLIAIGASTIEAQHSTHQKASVPRRHPGARGRDE
ncbi:MAG: hypothetical protein OXP69_22410 [Spirochaetaceae bacterium]|nr:hypothetical protein [Spirochaetaceae bacterium]